MSASFFCCVLSCILLFLIVFFLCSLFNLPSLSVLQIFFWWNNLVDSICLLSCNSKTEIFSFLALPLFFSIGTSKKASVSASFLYSNHASESNFIVPPLSSYRLIGLWITAKLGLLYHR